MLSVNGKKCKLTPVAWAHVWRCIQAGVCVCVCMSLCFFLVLYLCFMSLSHFIFRLFSRISVHWAYWSFSLFLVPIKMCVSHRILDVFQIKVGIEYLLHFFDHSFKLDKLLVLQKKVSFPFTSAAVTEEGKTWCCDVTRGEFPRVDNLDTH